MFGITRARSQGAPPGGGSSVGLGLCSVSLIPFSLPSPSQPCLCTEVPRKKQWRDSRGNYFQQPKVGRAPCFRVVTGWCLCLDASWSWQGRGHSRARSQPTGVSLTCGPVFRDFSLSLSLPSTPVLTPGACNSPKSFPLQPWAKAATLYHCWLLWVGTEGWRGLGLPPPNSRTPLLSWPSQGPSGEALGC